MAAGGALAGAEAVWEVVHPLLPGFTVEVVAEIASTNSELMRRARAGEQEPVLLVAERQTAGRGRLGRDWASGAADSLTFSLGLGLAPADWSGLSLAVGVALAEALHPRVQLKWPNDLWLSDRKLGGILIETAQFGDAPADRRRYTVVGIGLNLAERPADGLRTPPAWLGELLPGTTPAEALKRVALPLVQALQLFESQGFAPFGARFAARDALEGREVILTDGTAGTAAGVDENGGLLVHTATGRIAVTSSEVSVRPA